MSLETLLEAAKYLEYRSQVKARGEEPHDYYTFSKLSAINSDVTSITSQSSHSHQRHATPSSNSSNSMEETKERRRTTSSTSRDSLLSQDHSGSGTREVHNKLEKNRRAHLKECFEALKKQLPNMDERKTSNLSILRGAIRYIQILKRKEREHEHDLEKLARDKIAFQQQLAALKKDLTSQYEHVDVNALMVVDDNETTTTASECGGASDFEDDFPNDMSSTSNQNSRLASDDTSSLSSTNAAAASSSTRTAAASSSPAQALAFPKQTSSNSVFPLGLKSAVVKNNSLFASEALACGAAKVLSRSAAHDTLHSSSIADALHSPRVMSTSNLQSMAGILAAPHTVQVITPPSGIKLLATSNAISPVNARQQGQIHVLAPSGVSYVTSPPIAAATNVKAADPGDSIRCKQQPPITLVTSQAFVGLSQVTTNSKPVIVNQSSELMTPVSATQLMMKSPVFGSNMALAVKNSNVTDIGVPTSQNSMLHISKGNPQLLQPASSAAQNVASLISSEGGNLRAVPTPKTHSISSSTCNLLSHGTSMAQLVSQSPITVPPSHIVAPGVTPLVGSVSVVSHTGALHHHQILAQSPSLGKVLASPILKSINQVNPIPIIQPQFLQAAGSNQHLVKPVVVVSVPNIIHPNNLSPLAQRPIISAADQCENICSPVSSIQK